MLQKVILNKSIMQFNCNCIIIIVIIFDKFIYIYFLSDCIFLKKSAVTDAIYIAIEKLRCINSTYIYYKKILPNYTFLWSYSCSAYNNEA